MDADAFRLARGFIEGSTEWEFRELPEHLQRQLVEVAGEVHRWIEHQSKPIIITRQIED